MAISNSDLLYEIIQACSHMETSLTRLGATGRGPHEKISSVKTLFDTNTIRQMRYIATIRNQAAHENNLAVDISRFRKAVSDVQNALQNATNKTDSGDEQKLDTAGLWIAGVLATGWLITKILDIFD
ncbi:hypothetical protein CB172_13145 [Salmonella enterica subsp. enterica serovar Claibornei]|nr:hypothetical protein [Salmonella enterica subsp. enterica serovar Claibornei]